MSETVLPALAGATQEAAIVAALGRRAVVLVGMMGAGKSTIGPRIFSRFMASRISATARRG
jgi:shikimate kinase